MNAPASSPGFSGNSPGPAAQVPAFAPPASGAPTHAPHLRSVPAPGAHTPAGPQHHQPQGGAQQLPSTPEYQAIVQALAAERDRGSRLERELGTHRTSATQSAEVLERLRQALNPNQPQVKTNPFQERRQTAEQRLDYMLNAALEAERVGRPMPLTANLSADLYQWQIEQAQREEQLMTRLEAMQTKLDQATNPDVMIDHQAFTSMDNQIQRAVETIYGNDPNYQAPRQAQFRAIAAQMTDEIKDLKENDPRTWDEIRRNPTKIQRMVNYFVEHNLPPRARQILQQEQIMREPQTTDGLFQAFREAQQAYANDPKQMNKMLPTIRAELLAQIMADRKNNGRPRIAGMYRG